MTHTNALTLRRDLGAPPRLVTHVRPVGEAGDLLLVSLARFGVTP